MPISKQKPTSEPLWKTWDILSQKEGIRHSVYHINGDKYIGEWKVNKKDGKGSSYSRNGHVIYNGDWKTNLRHGYGTLSVRNESMKLVKEYVGGWKYDRRHGFGTRYYGKNEYYEGEWYADMRSGWGRMYYVDGSVYEGEWLDDQRSGDGILRLPNQNRYEGKWLRDLKNGEGKFFYMDTGNSLVGFWVDDISKCGTFEDNGRLETSNPTTFSVPINQLVSSDTVLLEAASLFR